MRAFVCISQFARNVHLSMSKHFHSYWRLTICELCISFIHFYSKRQEGFSGTSELNIVTTWDYPMVLVSHRIVELETTQSGSTRGQHFTPNVCKDLIGYISHVFIKRINKYQAYFFHSNSYVEENVKCHWIEWGRRRHQESRRWMCDWEVDDSSPSYQNQKVRYDYKGFLYYNPRIWLVDSDQCSSD